MSAVQNHPSASETALIIEPRLIPGVSSAPQWTEFAGFVLLLVACYWTVIVDTGKILVSSDDLSHGLFAPLVTGFMLWGRRRLLFVSRPQPQVTGLILVILGALIGTAGVIGASSTLGRVGALLSLTGCIWLLGGRRAVEYSLYPLAILLFTFPIPSVLYAELTMPLQRLATICAEHALEFLGFSVLREGNVIVMSHIQLSVVEACSGIRSLITLLFFCVVYGYFFEPKPYLRAVLILLAVPSAVFMNVMRIVSTGVLSKSDLKWAHGSPHEMLGYAGLVLSFALVYLLHRGISQLTSGRRAALR